MAPQGRLRAVFLDIDGTLITDQGDGPFEDDIAGIEAARRQGHRFFICTGRGYANVYRVFKEAPYLDGMVAGGGAYVTLGGRVIHRRSMDPAVLCQVGERFFAEGRACSFQGEREYFTINKTPLRAWRTRPIPLRPEDDLARIFRESPITMLTADNAMGPSLRAFMDAHFRLNPQKPHFDCFIPGEDKARGMKIVLDALGLDRQDSAAVGDSANDLEMFRYAGTSIAVGNACEELKAAADWISAPCGQGGVVRALEHLGLI